MKKIEVLKLSEYKERCNALLSAIDKYTNEDVIIAFSGGVDSSLLLKLACESAKAKGTKIYAVTFHTALHPMHEIDIAQKVAEEAGAIHYIIKVDELKQAGIENNPKDRCYLCKKSLFERLKNLADELQIITIIEGTNEDDLHVYRPGIRAIRELGIHSPLAASLMTKTDVRKMAAEYDVSVADRPSTPCMATRFPYDTPLSYDKMHMVEKGEEYLRNLGFYNERIRVHDDIARIEVDLEDLTKLLKHREDIVSYLKNLGFAYVTADLEGFRSGSMDYKLNKL